MGYSTITESFKKSTLDLIVNDWKDTTNTHYYIAISRAEEWNDSDVPPEATITKNEELQFRQSMQSMKLVENLSYVVPRIDWSVGKVYAGYDNTVSGHPTTPYFVITSENNVYICLQAGTNIIGEVVASIVKPTETSSFAPFQTSDGYIWKYLYTVDYVGAENYLSGNFMPVKVIEDGYDDPGKTYTDQDTLQYNCQQAAVPGQITNIVVISEGVGYSVANASVTIDGDGTGASFSPVINDGKIVGIKANVDSDGTLLLGSGYTYANVVIGGTNTTPASARAIVSTREGFGANPIVDLRAKALMFNTKFINTEGGYFFVGQDFRQLGIIRNPLTHSDDLYTASSGNSLRYLEYQSYMGTPVGSFSADYLIQGETSGAKAFIDKFSEDPARLYFHQNEVTGYGEFDSSEAFVQAQVNPDGSISTIPTIKAQITSINNGDINPLSGEVLYIENREPVGRVSEQTEDIKIIIQL